jgi:alkaline phosphatase
MKAFRSRTLLAAVLLASWAMSPAQSADVPAPPARVKNVIVMIADGQGFGQRDAATLYQYGQTGQQVYEKFPCVLAMSTYPNGGGYDPQRAATDFEYVKRGTTDSAAAATALATGVKTYNGAIGVDPARKPVKNVLERAEELGKATGVVTTKAFSDATPAGFAAHNVSRSNFSEIANEMIQRSALDVIMGCGNPFCDDNAHTVNNPHFNYVGGQTTWEAVTNGTAGKDVDADHNGALDDAWTLITTKEQFQALATGPAPKRVIGVAQTNTTLQEARSGDAKAAAFAVPFNEGVPTLADMSVAALNVLHQDPDGFAIMIEGAAVDSACHSNLAGRAIEEEIDFNKAVEAVAAWIEKNSRWDETLLIVTADHETGYLIGPGSGPDAHPTVQPLVSNGARHMPGMEFRSKDHTNQLVPLQAKGAGSEMPAALALKTDPLRGKYVDNTDVAKVIFAAMEGKRP